MEHSVKIFSHIELIKAKMAELKWKPADLFRSSGVSTGILSRYFNGKSMSADNLFRVLQSLDLLGKELHISNEAEVDLLKDELIATQKKLLAAQEEIARLKEERSILAHGIKFSKQSGNNG